MKLLLLFTLIVILSLANGDILRTCLARPTVKIVETQIDGPVAGEVDKAITWLTSSEQAGQQVVLLTSMVSTLWRSSDSGRTWQSVTLPGLLLDRGVRSIVVSADEKVVIALGYGKNMWKSTDKGKTFDVVNAPGYMDDLKFHPLQSSWVIGTLKGCMLGGSDCSNDLYFSSDYGTHWGILRKNIWVADWHGYSDDEKLLVVWESTVRAGASIFEMQLVSSTTFFRSEPTVIAKNVLGYKSMGSKIFIATAGSKGLILLVSENFGTTFNDVRFPLGLAENRYTLLDTTEGLTFINVEHDDYTWGNVYASNAFDTDFTLSLERNARAVNGKCDFKAVAGIEGIYIANSYASVSSDNTDSGTGKQTWITYDKGAKWSRLPTPTNFVCASTNLEDCSLNLIGISDFGTWYTRKEAIGIIIATGGVSRYLINKDSELGTYISRDAGWTWRLVSPGRYTYGIGNRGGLILMAANNIAVNTMSFSLDEGNTWENCDFTESLTTVEIQQIVTDPHMANELFLLYGTRSEVGVLISVDFSKVYERECSGHDDASNPTSDFEIWEPSDRKGDECLLGRSTKYIRRRQSNACTIPALTTDDVVVAKNCSCTEENYICDYCYVARDNKCVPDSLPECQDNDPKAPPTHCNQVYTETLGYRRVPGDTCDPTSGINHMPIVHPCPSSEDKSTPLPVEEGGRPVVLIAFVIIVIIVAGIAGVWWFSSKNEKVREFLTRFVPEDYLPEFVSLEGGKYSRVHNFGDDDLEEDAPELDIEDSTVKDG